MPKIRIRSRPQEALLYVLWRFGAKEPHRVLQCYRHGLDVVSGLKAKGYIQLNTVSGRYELTNAGIAAAEEMFEKYSPSFKQFIKKGF